MTSSCTTTLLAAVITFDKAITGTPIQIATTIFARSAKCATPTDSNRESTLFRLVCALRRLGEVQ